MSVYEKQRTWSRSKRSLFSIRIVNNNRNEVGNCLIFCNIRSCHALQIGCPGYSISLCWLMDVFSELLGSCMQKHIFFLSEDQNFLSAMHFCAAVHRPLCILPESDVIADPIRPCSLHDSARLHLFVCGRLFGQFGQDAQRSVHRCNGECFDSNLSVQDKRIMLPMIEHAPCGWCVQKSFAATTMDKSTRWSLLSHSSSKRGCSACSLSASIEK